MAQTSSRTAPAGTVCCYLCRRYQAPEKMDGTRCTDRRSCQNAAAQLLGRPRKPPKAMRAEMV